MALPNVSITYRNGGLGLVPASDDRVCGLILNGNQFAQPVVLYGMKDLENYLATNASVFAYDQEIIRQVGDFYLVAGEGQELWMLTISSELTTANLFSSTGPVQQLIDASGGRVNVVAVSRFLDAPSAPTLLDGLEADVLNGMDEAHALGVANATRNQPVRFILDGKHFSGDVVALRNLKTHSFNRVAINVATIRPNTPNAAQGFLLGRIASIPVNRSIARVKDGSMPTSEAYLTNGQWVKAFGQKATALHDKGFIFLRTFVNKSGFFWNDDRMATGNTDDYFSLSNGRVIDKAARIAYATFIEELNDTVTVNERGKIVKGTLKQYQARIERAIGLSMAAEGEISFVEAFVDPDQDVLATSSLRVDLRITPTGTNRAILVELGLFNPNAQLS